jgi:hypothetical protein
MRARHREKADWLEACLLHSMYYVPDRLCCLFPTILDHIFWVGLLSVVGTINLMMLVAEAFLLICYDKRP